MERNILSAVVGLVFVAIMASLVFASVRYTQTCEKKWTQDLVIDGDTGRAELRDIQVCK